MIKQIKNKQRKQKRKRLPKLKIYFQFIIHQEHYIKLPSSSRSIENIHLLLKNRKAENIIFMSSNPFRIVAAMHQKFLTIPVVPQQYFIQQDIQLVLVEHYILKLRHLDVMKGRIFKDFESCISPVDIKL